MYNMYNKLHDVQEQQKRTVVVVSMLQILTVWSVDPVSTCKLISIVKRNDLNSCSHDLFTWRKADGIPVS